MTRLRVRVAQLITRIFAPLCPHGCRQPVDRCTCRWVPRLPEE